MAWHSDIEQWANHIRQRNPFAARLVWDGRQVDFGAFETPLVTMYVREASALRYLLSPSLDGLGEAYVRGVFDVEGALDDVIDLAYALSGGGENKRFKAIAGYFRHSRKADRQAIQYHYDVSDAFYALWLDPEMVYSCAYFETGLESLEEAQLKKIDHILTKLKLAPGQSLLDIGCGWGGLVMRAAQRFGVRCLGITLSRNQYEAATRKVRAAGLQDRIEIRLQDYRDVNEQFDRIASVGMCEHVGIKGLPAYFRRINDMLYDDGMALNHGITMVNADSREAPFGAGRFMEKYVFPGGELPHVGEVLRTMQQGGLEVLDVESLRRHYAKTLAAWSRNFETNSEAIRLEVGEEKFRIWRVYLSGCAYAFRHDVVSIYQVLCHKAGRDADSLDWSRRYMYAK
ncbi:SAM-dependent methyltransferase [Chromobacterium sphagni]|uniref:Cyclopropane-fatty-acyl-phospholipid synthase n=1 Tax=Chromobacterium sphagni TaxID=1903179 RepID=A0A1S1WVF6_9NEIS|nr:cyclopropane-fatty-acyl-phospholipid synthase family protein [Chromobacterium sphagni]OHX11219.1 cyclopropane-fatty-acyl-phospholipid synthase [Chromobacterium sphagni]OHX19199.1 cyclopropane-fatty-acyl-phospholipid synthase [Chromobacterium sphagni]